MPEPLPLTGERTLPGIWHERYWFARHEVVYRWLATRLPDRPLLDAGCGEGYGAALLAGAGRPVVALDYDVPTVAHASARYPGVRFVRGNLVALPFADGGFGSVATLQTVEHVWDQPGLVAECRRVLRPRGTLAVSTPNRLTFSPEWSPGEPHLNPFHTRELSGDELAALLAGFAQVRLLGVHHGERIARFEREHGPLVAGQLAADPDGWPPPLAAFVATVTAADFVVAEAGERGLDGSLDLLALAVAGG